MAGRLPCNIPRWRFRVFSERSIDTWLRQNTACYYKTFMQIPRSIEISESRTERSGFKELVWTNRTEFDNELTFMFTYSKLDTHNLGQYKICTCKQQVWQVTSNCNQSKGKSKLSENHTNYSNSWRSLPISSRQKHCNEFCSQEVNQH